jgi:DNA replication factor GINS
VTTTYDEIQQAWKRELQNPELQPLRQGFFKDLASYIKRLKEAQRNLDPKSLKAIVMDEEEKRLEQLLNQLVDRRLEKLCTHANKDQSTNLESSEKQVYQDLSGIARHYEKFKEELLQGREQSGLTNRRKSVLLVRFVKDVPSIIGVDLKTHGPFLKEDIAKLPFENAESLIRQGAAVEIGASSEDNE